MAHRILVIDTDSSLKPACEVLNLLNSELHTVAELERASEDLQRQEFDPHLVILDADLHPEFCQQAYNHDDLTEWVLIKKNPDELNSELEELIFDCLATPLDLKKLRKTATRAIRSALTRRRLQKYASQDSKLYHLDAYIGKSAAVRELKELLARLIDVPLTSLIITGESGTGKGLVARIVHTNGKRKDGPLVELNCAALPRDLLESELFGHEAGAFTGAKGRYRGLFEQADGGTLFLDEIAEMDIDLQAKLLKAIEDNRIRRLGSEREISVDVQIIAATAVNLEDAVNEGKFRDDLYHRLNVFNIPLPPLRERREDIVELVPHIVAEFNDKANKRVDTIGDDVWEALLSYEWPGNIRELRNVLERCVLLSSDYTLSSRWLNLSDNEIKTSTHTSAASGECITLPLDGSLSLDEMDKFIIENALSRHEYNVSETAKKLGTTRETLRYRIQKYQLKLPK